jgi:Flp pilus assembly protein TadD
MIKYSICFLAVFFMVSCSPVGKDNRIKILFEKANKRLNSQQYQAAIGLYDEILSMNPDIMQVYHNRGVAYYESGHPVLALADYNQVLNSEPENSELYFNRAKTYLDLGRFESCKEDVELLKRQYPDTALVYFIEGLLNHQIDNNIAAVESFTQAISFDQNNGETFANRGMAYFALGEYENAESDLISGLKKDPGNAFSINALALVKAEQGQVEIADSLIIKALRAVPDQPIFLNNKGYINILKGDFEQAKMAIDQSLSLNEGNAWAHQNLGILFNKTGRYQESLTSLNKAESLNPKLKKVTEYLIRSYNSLGDPSKACELLTNNREIKESVSDLNLGCVK